jgi:pimeloyl-ACP methyl ester carboxylesterase
MSPTVTSTDGTPIAFDRTGAGPPLILVDGALCDRAGSPNGALAELLADRFAVYTYDRRGRGASGDTGPYAVEREVEDIGALIEAAGGSAGLYGISSGAALALEAANRGLPVEKLALYEAPYVVDDSRPPLPADYPAQLDSLLASDRRGDAIRLFMTEGARVPRILVAMMRFMPAWTRMKQLAHTLRYDAAVMGDGQGGKPLPQDRWPAVIAPTLVLGGSRSPAWMRNAVQAVADRVPNAQHRTLDGQTHLVKAKVLAPVLSEFFAS